MSAPDATGTTRSATGRTGSARTTAGRSRPQRTRARRIVRRIGRLSLVAIVLTIVAVAPTTIWIWTGSAGHLYTVDSAPETPVVIVFGAELTAGGKEPKPVLAGRLAVAAQLVRTGKAKAILISGDGHGASGDEVAVMRAYLLAHDVPARRIVGDPYGLDTYDSCLRARAVYGVRRALLVSQSFHLPRAVTLCRHAGIDANGVEARCDGCLTTTRWKDSARELPASWKAAYDTLSGRPPAVSSQHDDALTEALEG